MKLLVLSDLHFEFHRDGGRTFMDRLPKASELDVVVIAGDLCPVPSGLLNALKLFVVRYPHVVFVPGNHEYWSSDRGRVNASLNKAAERSEGRLHVLQEDVVELFGRRLLGTTLWFPPSPLVDRFSHSWSDFQRVTALKSWYSEAHDRSKAFLSRETKEGDIVITHHLPSNMSVARKYRAQASNCFFVGPVDEIVLEKKPALFIHGHTHESMDYELGQTRVVCNPFGYAGYEVNAAFKRDFIVEV